MKYVYLILSAMLLLCVAPMPYGYYELVRFVATIAFVVLAYVGYRRRNVPTTVAFIILALLFQPFSKLVLGRSLWIAVDVVTALFLTGLYFVEKQREKAATATADNSGRQLPPREGLAPETNRIGFVKIKGMLSPRDLVYVASEEDRKLTAFIESHPEVLEGWGKMIGYNVVYLPLLLQRLKDKRVQLYRAPYLSGAELVNLSLGNDFLLKFLANPDDKSKVKSAFVRMEAGGKQSEDGVETENRYYPISSESGESLGNQLHDIGKQITLEGGSGHYLGSGTGDDDDEESTDDLLEEVRETIAKLRQRGIGEYILEQLIHPDNRLSRMVITADWRIVLPDYNGMEIKMEPLVKAVYLLFLKHPEGISFKDLPDHRRELTDIYKKLRPQGLTERARQSIADVTDPLQNSINEKCARIRGAFLGQFDDYMARNYYVDGPRGGEKKITLPREMVKWEREGR